MDEAAFAEHINAIREKLYRIAILYLESSADALEAVDESVFRGLRSLSKLQHPEFFDTWITRITINVCYTELRRKKREHPVEELPESASEAFDALPLREAVAKLPEELRSIIVLRYFTGLTLEETAKVLQLPRGTVSTRQRKALSLLRLDLEEVF